MIWRQWEFFERGFKMFEYIKIILITGVPFGIILSVFTVIVSGTYLGILPGTVSGLVFGSLSCAFVYYQKSRFKKISSEITNGKTVIMDGAANHFRGKEAVGGWLFLTNDELIFKSHNINVQRHQTVIQLNGISDVTTASTLGIVPNGLLVITTDGTKERFVVNNRQNWIKNIKQVSM
jgi:hypothetical protein